MIHSDRRKAIANAVLELKSQLAVQYAESANAHDTVHIDQQTLEPERLPRTLIEDIDPGPHWDNSRPQEQQYHNAEIKDTATVHRAQLQLAWRDTRFSFSSDRLSGSQMFSVNSLFGSIHVTLNIDHPCYEFLRELEELQIENVDHHGDLAWATLRLLLSSWAATEGQSSNPEQRRRVQNMALDWGRQAEVILQSYRLSTEG